MAGRRSHLDERNCDCALLEFVGELIANSLDELVRNNENEHVGVCTRLDEVGDCAHVGWKFTAGQIFDVFVARVDNFGKFAFV